MERKDFLYNFTAQNMGDTYTNKDAIEMLDLLRDRGWEGVTESAYPVGSWQLHKDHDSLQDEFDADWDECMEIVGEDSYESNMKDFWDEQNKADDDATEALISGVSVIPAL